MKNIKSLSVIVFIATLSIFVSGCGTLLQKGEPTPVSVVQPVYAINPQTGLISQVGETNITGTVTPYTLSPSASNTLAAAQAVLAAGSSIPSPAAPIFNGLSIGLTALVGLIGIYARKKSGEVTLQNAALAATTTVIEAAENAAELKKSVQRAAMANGSEDFLHSKVKNL